MNRADVLQRIYEVGVVPVVRAASSEEAIQVIEAIKTGGLSPAEGRPPAYAGGSDSNFGLEFQVAGTSPTAAD
jgi:hypothetical protein